MDLTATSLRNPAAVAIGVVMVLLLGAYSLVKLPIQLFPEIDNPTISIQTVWSSASPREIEAEIVEPIEEVLQGIPGVQEMTAWANAGNAWINLRFGLEADMQQAAVDVISRMNRLPALPADAEPPIIMAGAGQDNTPALTYFFVQLLPGNPKDPGDYAQFVEDVIRPAIQAVPGVANVRISNGFDGDDELQVRFDPYRVADLGIQIPELAERIGRANDVSGGFVDVGRRQYTLRFAGRYEPEDLKELVLEWRDGRPIRLGDVADIEIARSKGRAIVTQNGNRAFSLRIDRVNGANALDTLNRVKAVVDELKSGPLAANGLTMAQSFDASVFIYRAINLVTSNLVLGVCLAVGVLWWFLRRMRATLIVALAIPISLLATFIVLRLTGRTINVISLAGLAFATGMVLDAAIVVLENIIRHREQGDAADTSAHEGARQVWGALLASTTTTVAIFVPVLMLEDIEGQLFGDLALTISIAVIMSLIVAVTVLPVAARAWVHQDRHVDHHQRLWNQITRFVMRRTRTRGRRVSLIVALMALPLVFSWQLLPELDYLPPVKRNAVDTFFVFPPGISRDTIEREYAQVMNARLEPYLTGEKEPALLNHYIMTWPGGGGMAVRPRDIRRIRDLERIIRDEITADLPDLTAYVDQVNLFGEYGGGRDINLHLQSRDRATLTRVAEQAMGWINESLPAVSVRPEPALQLAEPELRLSPNDRNLGEVGWTRDELGQVVRAAGDGLYVGEYFDGDQRLNVVLRSQPWSTPDQLSSLPLFTPAGQTMPLSEFARVSRTVGPTQLKRVAGRRTVTLRLVPPEDMSLERAIAVIRDEIEPRIRAALPTDGSLRYGGSADNLRKAIRTMSENFGVALLLLFLLMSALFRSPRDSLLVTLSTPLAMVGGVIALRVLNLFTFQPLDLLTMVGFVILLGLVVNNAILLVHQTRSAERDGMDRRAAVELALQSRLRPIFMSTLTSIFGMLPLLLAPGAGSVIYRGLAAVIVGGMCVSALFTLLLLPALLSVGSRRERRTVPEAFVESTEAGLKSAT
ncbi:MAG: efflux RND transporter permease subunit [Gammaproteobacteria bacterium]